MANLVNRPDDAKIKADFSFAAVILAAGLGRRMKSNLPKVMHRAAGRTLIGHVLSTLSAIGPSLAIVVVGPGEDAVVEETRRFMPDALTVIQPERKGTGHAARVAAPLLETFTGKV